MDERELIVKNEDGADRVSKTKTIYDARVGEIFWKNFLAGFSRTIGGIFVYLIFFLTLSNLFLNFLLPKISPIINSLSNISNSLGSFTNNKSQPVNILPPNIGVLKIFGK